MTLVCWPAPPRDLVLVGVRLPGRAEYQDVLIRSGKIVSVGHFPIPRGASRLEAGGRTLLPGFQDSHVHLQLSEAGRCLRGGTTTLRDLGWTPSTIFGRRAALQATGPDLLAAGGILCPPGGYPSRAGWCPDQDRIERMVAHKVAVCPTLHIGPSPQRVDNLARFVKAGGTVLYGTDLGNYGPPPGIDVQELRLMGRAGMTPQQIIDSATIVPARWMGLKDRGAVQVGMRADLILVDGDPLRDLSCLGRPWKVLYRGEPVGP